ncbi:hypothetical protein L1887_24621 [Cichorium endivia]|nr:hypothetical protein L1887_24621 [Cichorium endivia]
MDNVANLIVPSRTDVYKFSVFFRTEFLVNVHTPFLHSTLSLSFSTLHTVPTSDVYKHEHHQLNNLLIGFRS